MSETPESAPPERSHPEFSRMVDRRTVGERPLTIEADEKERTALAVRFGLVRIDRLTAEVALRADGACVDAAGRLEAEIVQSCAVSGEDLPVGVDEPLSLRFVPEAQIEEEELELEEGDCDEIAYAGDTFDLGEAVAQSLALAIDPYAVGPLADEARREAGIDAEGETGPMADALAALRKQL